MEREIEAIRRNGYCFTSGEGEIDMACVAAPIYDHSGAVIAGLSIGGPVHRMSEPATTEVLIGEAIKAAREISSRLGCTDGPGTGTDTP
jgi:DNA-binding IclR family transcriptional regulator